MILKISADKQHWMSYFTFQSGVKRTILGRESEGNFFFRGGGGREIGRFTSGDEFFAFLFPDKNVVDVSGQGLVKDVGIDAPRGSISFFACTLRIFFSS